MSIKQIVEIAADNREQLSTRSRRITIDESQREELFAQLREFGNKYAFEILIREAGPNGEGFFIEMLRDDIYTNANIASVDPKIVSIRLFDKDPKYPVDEETVDACFIQ